MNAFIAEGPNKASFYDIDIPKLENDQVLVKIKYAGVCGTDYAIYTGNCSFVENGLIKYPVRFGHEWSGVIADVGSDVSEFKVSDRVIGDNFVACGKCEACQKDNYDNCTAKKCVGTIDCWDGCFAEYMVMPKRHVYHIADNVELMEAALVEPLSVAYGGIKKMNITKDSVVAVIGTGCIGMSAVALAKHKGAKKVVMIGRNKYKLDIALKVGADAIINTSECDAKTAMDELTDEKGADFILECSGVPSTIMQSIELSAQCGTIALVGFYEKKLNDIDIDMLVSKQLHIFGVMGEYGNLESVSKIMADDRLNLLPVITAKVPFSKCPSAFEDEPKNHNATIKTIIVMD